MLNLKECLNKWRPVLRTEYNEKILQLFAGFLEWKAMNLYITGIYTDLIEIKKEIDERIILNATRLEAKMFLNEYTGNFEYLIDGKFYNKKDIKISNDSIIKIFGEEYFNYLISEKLI